LGVPEAEPQRPSYDELARLVVAQAARIAELEALEAEVVGLRAELAELKRRLGSNSSNSSKPPSQDGLGKSKRSKGSSGGKRGKPFGAPGATRMLVDDPDERHERAPQACGGCGHDLAGAEEFCRQRRQVVDLPPPPKPHVTEYQVVSLVCPCCAEVSAGRAPDGVTGIVQFGPGVKARLAYLRGAQFLPFGRAAGALEVLGGLRVVPATVLAAVREAAERLGPFVDRVRLLLRAAAVIGADETPAWVDGGWKYVHVACTPTLTLLHTGSRRRPTSTRGAFCSGSPGCWCVTATPATTI
jgi:transposase